MTAEEEDIGMARVFYKLWMGIIHEITDEQLAATIYMLKNTDALNSIARGESVYRRMMREK